MNLLQKVGLLEGGVVVVVVLGEDIVNVSCWD